MTNLGRNKRPEVEIMTPQERADTDPRGLSRVAFIGSELVSVRKVAGSHADINTTEGRGEILRRVVEEDTQRLRLAPDRLDALKGKDH